MKIAQAAPLMESVPPELYGGTERVVSYLTEELVRLGLTFSAEKPQLKFSYPQLPDYIDFVRISNLQVGSGVIDLSLRRHTHDVGINVIRKEGDIDISVIV